MTPAKPVRLVPEARHEYLAAIDWYEDQRSGLGEAFVLAVDELLERLQPTGQGQSSTCAEVARSAERS